MKAGWEEVALGEVATITNGGTPKSKIEAYWGGSVPWITPKDMGQLENPFVSTTSRTITMEGLNNSSAKLVSEKSVILSTRAPIGHLAINEVPMAFNQGCRGITPGDRLDYSYLFYVLDGSREELNARGSGTTFKELSATNLKSLPIPLPPLEEQKRIVAVLDAAFAKLDRARANVEANLADAEELYASCLDGIVDGLREGHRVAITEVCAFKGGSQPPKKNFSKTPRKGFVRLLQIRDYETDEKAIYVDRNLVTKFCEKDDVMIGRYGASVGKILTGKEGAYNVALVRTIPDTQKLSKPFLFHYLQSRYFQSRLHSKSERGAQNGFNKGDLSQINVPLLPLDQQQTVADTMSTARIKSNTLSEKCEAQLADLEALRQSLLQRAFAGELT